MADSICGQWQAPYVWKSVLTQRSVVTMALGLKNVFGEVHHNPVQEVFFYHHTPVKVQAFISSLYNGFIHL